MSKVEIECKKYYKQLTELQNYRRRDQEREEVSRQEIYDVRQKLIEKEASCEALKKEIDNMEKKMADVQSILVMKCNNLEGTLEESQMKERKVENERRQLEVKLQNVNDELTEAMLKLSTAEGQVSALKEQLGHLEEMKKESENRLNDIQSSIRASLGPSVILRQDGISLDLCPDTLRSCVQELIRRLESADVEKDKSSKKIHSLTSQLNEMISEKQMFLRRLSELQKSLVDVEKDKKGIDGSLRLAKKSLTSQENAIVSLEQEKQILTNKILEMESRNSHLEIENNQYKEMASKSKDVESRLENEVRNQRHALNSSEALITELKVTKHALEGDLNKVRMIVQDKNTEMKVLKERIESMNKNVSVLNDKNVSFQLTVDKLTTSLNKSTEGQNELQDKVMDLNKSLSETTSSSFDWQSKSQQLQSMLQNSERDRGTLHEQVEKSRRKIDELNDEKVRLTSEMGIFRRELSSKDEQVISVANRLESTNELLKEQRESEGGQHRKIQALHEEIRNLQSKLSRLEDQLESTERDKTLAQRMQSRLEKDRNSLKKALVQVEKDKISLEEIPLDDELQRLELIRTIQTLEVKLQEVEQLNSQRILDLSSKHKQEIYLYDKRSKDSLKHCDEIMKSRERAHQERVLQLEQQIQTLRNQLDEELQKRRLYISRTLKSTNETEGIRSTLHASLDNALNVDTPNTLNREISRLDKCVDRHLSMSNISIKTSSPIRSRTVSPSVVRRIAFDVSPSRKPPSKR
ncbi:Uncharacterised protein at_DN2183 [Pycnogonum litorale]